jgi:hypothetical protein
MATAPKSAWQLNPFAAGSGAFSMHGLTATGTDNESWTVNEDADAGVDEDSSLIVQGGDGTSLIAHHFEQNSGLGLLNIYKTDDGVEAGTTLSIGVRAQIEDLEQTLEFASGNAASPHIAKFAFSDTLGALQLTQETPIATPVATELKIGATAGGSLRVTELASDPASVADTGSLYVKDVTGNTELFFRSDSGIVQLTGGGSLTHSLQDAYDDGTAITLDGSSVTLGTDGIITNTLFSIRSQTAAVANPAQSILLLPLAYTGTPHGLNIDLSLGTSITNASDVYGLRVAGQTNAGAGGSVGLLFEGVWDWSISYAADVAALATLGLLATNVDVGNDARIVLNADLVELQDGTATLRLGTGGALTEEDLVSVDLTPDGTLTLRGGGVSQFGDDTAYWNFSGTGALTESGMTSVVISPAGSMTFTAGNTSTWSMSGSDAGTLTLTIDAINAGAGEGRLLLAADDQLDLNDGTCNIAMDAGVISETGMVSVTLSPSGAVNWTAGAASTWEIVANSAGSEALQIKTQNAGAGTSNISIQTDDNLSLVSVTGSVTMTADTSSTWSMSGDEAGLLTLTIDAINAGAGNAKLLLAADNQVDLDVGGVVMSVFADYAGLPDNKELRLGDGPDATLFWSTTQTQHAVMVGLGASNNLIITEYADVGINFAHANSTNPMLRIQGADHTAPADWIGFYHDQTDAYAESGAGNFVIKPVSGSYVVLSSTKGTTGDPTGVEGMIYINTFDNVIKMYADGAWRALSATW